MEPYSSSKRIRPRQHHLSSPRYNNNSVPAVGTCKRRRYAAQKDSNMGRCRGLYRVANLLSRVSESSVVQRASASDATLARRGLSSSATGSLHACQAPIAAGKLRKVACKAVQQISSAATATDWRHVSAGSPIRELLKNVSASNAVWGRRIATQALQPSDTYVCCLMVTQLPRAQLSDSCNRALGAAFVTL